MELISGDPETLACMSGSAAHALLRSVGGCLDRGTLDVPENIATQETRLVLELPRARFLRIVFGAKGDHLSDVLGRHGRRFGEHLDRTAALAWSLRSATGMGGMTDECRGREHVCTEAPRDIAPSATHLIEELALAGASALGTFHRDLSQIVDGERGLLR